MRNGEMGLIKVRSVGKNQGQEVLQQSLELEISSCDWRKWGIKAPVILGAEWWASPHRRSSENLSKISSEELIYTTCAGKRSEQSGPQEKLQLLYLSALFCPRSPLLTTLQLKGHGPAACPLSTPNLNSSSVKLLPSRYSESGTPTLGSFLSLRSEPRCHLLGDISPWALT